MGLLMGILRPLQAVIDGVLAVGRWFGIGALGLMVLVILLQVVMRYVFNSALPWPEEAARFLMLWLTGLLAPSAYRVGGFVAIDTIQSVLPRVLGTVLSLCLLAIATLVLITAVQLGYKHVFSGCLFKSSTLWLPFTFKFTVPIPLTDLDLTLCTRGTNVISFTWGWTKMPLALSFLSLWLGVWLLLLVNIELVLRAVVTTLGGNDRLRPMGDDTLKVE